ncbi:ATP-binding protein [Isobaculum melis]|uniref:Uncharacterized protein YhaN n=1 Tax=Isobaculum melis TaxID=142588 RepID=A0A1H9QK38_9LACT|nr:AAA family ATPase [Isobaculum melis]SER60757.1 Uncharacterized protein YhaN [Isobaculum melis]
MKICSLHIAGFGKWQNKDFTDLSNLQFIYGENEAGKSTIIAFIHSILFGFPSNKGHGKSFEPMNGQVYGGSLIIEHPVAGKVKIERFKQGSGQQLTVFFDDGRKAGEKALNQLLNGIDQQQYLRIFSFDLFGIQKVHQVLEKDLNRYFLSIGMTGSDNEMQVADAFLKKGEQLYKPKGRNPELNQQALQLKKMKQQLQIAKEKNAQYMVLFKQKLASNEGLLKEQQGLQQLNQQLVTLTDLAEYWTTYEEYLDLKAELDKHAALLVDEEDVAHYQHYQQQLQNLTLQLAHLKEQEIAVSEKFDGKPVMEQAQLELLQRKIEEWPMIHQKEEEMKLAREKLGQLENVKTKEAYQANLNPNWEGLEVALTPELLKHIRLTNNQLKAYQQEYELSLLKQQQHLEKSTTIQEQITRLEPQLVSKKQLAIAKELFEKDDKRAKSRMIENKRHQQAKPLLNQQKLGYVGIGLSIVFLLLAFVLLKGSMKYGSLFIFVVTGTLSVISLLKSKQATRSETIVDGVPSHEIYQRQLADRTHYQQLNSQLDELQAALEVTNVQLMELNEKKDVLAKELTQLKVSLALPEAVTNDELEEKVTILLHLQQLILEQVTLKAQLQKNEKVVNQWLHQCEIMTASFTLDWSQPAASIEKLRYLIERQKETQFASVGKNRQREQISKQKAELEEQQQQLTQWLADFFVSHQLQNEAAFFNEQKRLAITLEQTTHYQVLAQQLEARLPLLVSYQSLASLKEEMTVIQQKIKVANQQLNNHLTEKAQLEVALEQLEEGKHYTHLLQQYGNQKEQFREKAKTWLSYQVATYMIEQTLAFGKEEQLPKTLRTTEKILHQLTNGKYQKLSFQEERFVIQDNLGNHWRAVDLSQGTSEQLYLALRLAFIINLSDTLQLPIMIDDAFVHFDQQRKAAAFELLIELSQKHQIFYFSCQNENEQFFKEEHQIHLSISD